MNADSAFDMPPAFEPSPRAHEELEASFAEASEEADAELEATEEEVAFAPAESAENLESAEVETEEASEEEAREASAPNAAKSAEAAKEGVTVIPDRVYFRIGDVAEITGIKPYVLRFWEKEFEIIHPVKNNSGQRIYRKSDVEAVLLIKRLLYLERFSIEGAKKRIRELRKSRELGTAKRKRGELDETKLSALFRVRRGLSDLSDYVAAYKPGK